MKPIAPVDRARRAFLQRAAWMGAAGTAAPWALNLSLLADAAAATSPSDYKALVCVFLYGGNDHANTVVPVDPVNHATYARLRGALALDRDALLPQTLTPTQPLPDGLSLALHPSLAPLVPLWTAGRLAVQLNVGPLIQPTSVAQYNARSVPLPPKLFSHNDQQSVWQSDLPEGALSGWGGRMGDLILSGNGGSLFSCISVTGNSVFLTGQDVVQYQVGSGGPVAITGLRQAPFGSAAAQAAMRTLITSPRTHLFEEAYGAITRRSIDAESTLSAALAATPALTTTFAADNPLAVQMQMVARLIAARERLGLRRQVFMVSLGGFDLHDNLMDNHPGLLARVAGALASFQSAVDELGVGSQVTAFTASDFGRTLSSNGDGSDHGWGAHHLVLGGAVAGRRFYGQAPALAINGPDDVGQGRLLPTTAVDQYAATLARWFGIAGADLPDVVPRIGAFASSDLGYFAG